jgi:hypothetical protein
MLSEEIYARSPMRVFNQSIHGGLAAGELGGVIGRAGVGKSVLLVHLALDRILRDDNVLHISLRDSADHVRSFYDELFPRVTRAAGLGSAEALAITLERRRMIQAYLNRPFTSDDLLRALDMLGEFMQFEPRAVLIDGFPAEDREGLEALAIVARDRKLAIWIAVQTHRDDKGVLANQDKYHTLVSLKPVQEHIVLSAMKVHGNTEGHSMGLELDPTRLMVLGEDTWDPTTAPFSADASSCTLYSGGARGAEAYFGELANKFGLSEVNFSFDGHHQDRAEGRVQLTERELAAGDVSLKYVSRRLHRDFTHKKGIRKILQSLWHQVSRAQQIFVVGVINEDLTVEGGTGWSVELARMWHKDLWVYDQAQQGWFSWARGRWESGVPVINSEHVCGTGTRRLEDCGRNALTELFERSFSLYED